MPFCYSIRIQQDSGHYTKYIVTVKQIITAATAIALLAILGHGSRAQEITGGYGSVIIGRSVEHRLMRAYFIGTGSESVIIMAGIHGGYEWNTIVLARELRDYFKRHPDRLPVDIRLYIIPAVNPDGLRHVTGGRPVSEVDIRSKDTIPGRFNANGIWYGGKPDQWEPARRFARTYADTSGYPLPAGDEGPVDYEITGSASQYLYSKKIPTIIVELETHSQVEFDRNLRAVAAVLKLVD